MASPHESPVVDDNEPPRIDMQEHERTYEAFMSLTKWGMAVVVAILVGMAVFLL